MKTVEAEPGTPGKWLRRMFDESLPRRPFPSRKQSWHSPRMESDHQTLNQRQVRFSRFPVKGIYAFSLDVFNLSFCDNFPHHPVCLRLVYAGAWGGWRQATQSQGRRSVPEQCSVNMVMVIVMVNILDGWVLVMVIILDGWVLAEILFPVMIICSDGRGCDKIEGDL